MTVKPVSFGAILTQIAAQIEAAELMPSAARIEPGPGNISETWISRHPAPHGAALVATGGLDSLEHVPAGAKRFSIGLGIWLIPQPEKRQAQAAAIADLASAFVLFVDENGFGIAGAKRPQNLTAKNLFSPSLEKAGTTLWKLEWKQTFLLFTDTGAVQGGMDV